LAAALIAGDVAPVPSAPPAKLF